MTPLEFTLLAAAVSIAAGFLGAILGLGGGIIVIPALTLWLHIDIRYAIGASIGLDYQDSLLSPNDPTNAVRGTAIGFKVALSYDFDDDKQPFEASLVGEYSTAFETYYAELRVGARLTDKVSLGPAVEADGTTGYNSQRLGAYVTYAFDLAEDVPLSVTIVGGHQFVSGDGAAGPSGGAGTYGTLELTTNF